ncbi:AsmA family protein [Vibrio sp. S17_S38]|uniref:AsmA family protein n=1 Tax=Vibrio sp. S17_S38 TaxID=2720229 RepID=UPI0016800595|nr:AsmA family protein [Vibrio sp. S17_S38]MBD1571756.1 AsmA family protein [Vibrio sp. S17_S38]
MKKVLIFLAVPITAILIAVLALVFFVNPNQFKPLIIEQTKAQTGFDLVIDGDIEWTFFPHIGFTIGKTKLLNPNGFKRAEIVKIDSVGLDISVLPLLEKRLEIGNISLNSADIFLQTKKDGSSNIDIAAQSIKENTAEVDQKETGVTADTAAKPEEASKSADVEESSSSASKWQLTLEGITVNNATLAMLDEQKGSEIALSNVNFALSKFSFDEWSQAEFSLTGRNNQQTFSAAGKTEFKVSQDLKNYELRNLDTQASFKDGATDIKTVSLQLTTFKFDQPNDLKLAVQGQVSGMNIDMTHSAKLMVNKAMSLVRLNDMNLKAKVNGKDLPLNPINIDMLSSLTFDLNKQDLGLTLDKFTVNELVFDGSTQVSLASSIPKIVFNLHSAEINVDALLKQMEQQSTKSAVTSSKTAESSTATKAAATASTANTTPTAKASTAPAQTEPDLSATKTLDVTGKITIDKLVANNANLQNVVTQFKVNRGVIDLQRFAANLYDGSILATAHIDARKSVANYKIHNVIKGVQVRPLLTDIADMDIVSGTGNITADLTGKSLLPDTLKKNLSGVINLNFQDGSLYGVNLPYEFRSAKAKLKGETIAADNVKKTDFSALTATMKLSKGVMKTNNFAMQSPLLRVLGDGQADYVHETLDFLVKTSIVGTMKGQDGKDLNDLKNLTIPVRVKGSWATPSISVDMKSLFNSESKQKAQKEIDKGIDKLLGDDKDSGKNKEVKKAAGDLLNSLFK